MLTGVTLSPADCASLHGAGPDAKVTCQPQHLTSGREPPTAGTLKAMAIVSGQGACACKPFPYASGGVDCGGEPRVRICSAAGAIAAWSRASAENLSSARPAAVAGGRIVGLLHAARVPMTPGRRQRRASTDGSRPCRCRRMGGPHGDDRVLRPAYRPRLLLGRSTGRVPQTLLEWVKRVEVDSGVRGASRPRRRKGSPMSNDIDSGVRRAPV